MDCKQSVFLRIQVRNARAVKQKVWNEAENRERGFFSFASQALRACEVRALRVRKILTARFTDFFTDFEKKTRLFCSLITQRFLFLVSTVSPRNAWHNDPHLCTDYESRCLRMQARLINYKHKSTHGVSFLNINFSELFQLKLLA